MLLLTTLPVTTFAASKTNQVRISYVSPEEPELLELSHWILERRPLERLQEFVSNGYLPKKRALACEEDYELIQDGYEALVVPHIDQDLAKEIFKRDWLRDN